MSIRLLLTFVVAFEWHTQQVDYVAAYTQVTEFRQPLQVQSHLEMPRILVQLGHTQRT